MPRSGPFSTHQGTKGEREDNIWSFSITACLLPQFILAPQCGEGRHFPSEPPRSPQFSELEKSPSLEQIF